MANHSERSVRLLGLQLLIRRDGAGVHGVDEDALAGLEAQFAGFFPALERPREQDQGELGTVVQLGRTDVVVDLGLVLELRTAVGGLVQVGGFEDQAGARRLLQARKELLQEEKLREDVDLEVGINLVLCFVVYSDAETCVEDELGECVILSATIV